MGSGSAGTRWHAVRFMTIIIPAMKIDTDYYCFACGAKGDVIGLTAGLFGLAPYEAARKLIEDFQLPVTAEKCQERRKKYRNRNPVSVKRR